MTCFPLEQLFLMKLFASLYDNDRDVLDWQGVVRSRVCRAIDLWNICEPQDI
jgi:hypothetical protein